MPSGTYLGYCSRRRTIFILTQIVFLYLFGDERILLSISAGGRDGSKKHAVLLDGCGIPINNGNAPARDVVGGRRIGGPNEATDTAPLYCSDGHRRAVEYCSKDEHNKVMRRDGTVVPWGELRQYSILPLPGNASTPMPRCDNVGEYLSAIKSGKRTWADPRPPDEGAMEVTPSRFVPSGCFAPTLPPAPSKACEVLSQYDHVLFHGDSLNRMLRQAIYMALLGDYVHGALVAGDRNVWDRCQCDGQFSENRICRTFEGSKFSETVQVQDIPREPKLCANTPPFALGKRGMMPFLTRKGRTDPYGSINWNDIRCTDPNYRGALIVAQGGMHWLMKSNDTFQSMLQPIVTHPKFEECMCLGKLRFIWIAYHAQSRLIDSSYGRQSREKAISFNEDLLQSFEGVGLVPGEDVVIMDWFNMTAESQSSDGVHPLSDVNLAKAAQILYLAENWPFPKPRSLC